MPSLNVGVAILRDGRILLTKREDFEVWCLPGGAVDDRESIAQAAIREAREETGLEVELTHLVGVYSEPYGPHGGSHMVVLAAEPVGGSLRPVASEVIDIRYFGRDDLPAVIFEGQRRQVLDALEGIGGSGLWTWNRVWPFDQTMTRWDIYRLRDASGLSRQEFYERYFDPKQPDARQEIAGRPMR